MKNNYYLFMLWALICANFIQAQSCPESIGSQSTTTSVVFKITSGDCGLYNDPTLTINTTLFAFSSCNGTNLRYVYQSGPALTSPDTFIAYFSFPDGFCTYLNGVLVPLSNNDVALDAAVSIYPNPLIKEKQLTLKFAHNLAAQVFMYDVNGKLVIKDDVNNAKTKMVNTSVLNNGIYFLRIETDEASVTRKVIIMN